MSTGRALYEQKLQRARAHEYKTSDLAAHVRQTNMLHGNFKSDLRVENKIHQRRMQEMEEEAALERRIEEQRRAQERADKLARQEVMLVNEMRRQKEEQAAKERMVQRIREESEELKDLEQRLKLAYLNKERAAQLKEKELLGKAEKEHQQLLDHAMEDERQRQLELEQNRDSHRRAEALEAKRILEQQLEDKEKAKQEAFKQFLEEKRQVDAVVQRLIEEDQEALRHYQARQHQTKQYVDQYLKDREQWKEDEKKRMQEESRKIEEYARQKQEREDAYRAEQQRIQDFKDANIAAVRNAMEDERREREEMEYLRNELYIEEAEAKRRQAEQEAMEKRIRDRIAMMEANEISQKLKEEKKKQMAEEEEKFRQQLLAKFAEDERIEQMNQQKARMRREQHRKEADRLIQLRREQYALQQEEEKRERAMEQHKEDERRRIIEEERKRLLREHAGRLFGFLPKGVILSEDDLEVFPEDIRREIIAARQNQDLSGPMEKIF